MLCAIINIEIAHRGRKQRRRTTSPPVAHYFLLSLAKKRSLNNMAITAPLASPAPHKGLLARYPLSFFFLMAFAFTWIAWSPWVLSEDGLGLLPYQLGDTASGLL